MTAMQTVISTRDLRKSFTVRAGGRSGGRGGSKRVDAVRGVSFEVARGEIFGFLGPNGAGKTTTMRMLTTLLPVDAGSATVAGCDVAREPGQVRRRIGYVSQLGGSDELATGRENLILQARLYGISRSRACQRAAHLAELLDLASYADRRVATYSGGQRRRLDIALGLVHEPSVVFLDEPTTGLDPQSRANLWDHIAALRASGTTVFLTTHYLEEADALCDRLMIMDHGGIVAEGTPRSLKQQVAGDAIVISLRGTDLASGQPGGPPPAGQPGHGSHDSERAVSLLRGEPYVRELAAADGQVRLYVDDGATALPQLIRLLDGHGIGVSAIAMSEPTLDDVFLRQTGRSLRDSGAPGEAGMAPAGQDEKEKKEVAA